MPQSACGCQHNQTHGLCLEALKKNAKQKGTGLFVVPAPENGILECRVVRVKNISYQECVKRGVNCLAFQWVANSVMSFEKLAEIQCDHSCADRCDQLGCTCYNHTCFA